MSWVWTNKKKQGRGGLAYPDPPLKLKMRTSWLIRVTFDSRLVFIFDHFPFEHVLLLFVFVYTFAKTLEHKTGGEEPSLLVIRSVSPNSGSTILVASFDVADSMSGSRADGRYEVLGLIVTCLCSFLFI
ncbi:unnamed protein product [Cuscuta epithymum]|uniref:Uncharacterized protein n=1 Tax=Cuscuta epithymum TaxID=186058 RepID=A0AAV0DZ83_9ASTE|nr:unnamed protein product [Cuscuta epithymum]